MSGIRQSQLYAIRTTVGQEKSVALLIAERAKSLGLNIYSVIAPEEMKGYVIIEAAARHEVHQVIMGLRHVRSKVIGNISIEEIKHFLIPKPPTEGLEVGDVVEVIGGPFKGEKAKITLKTPVSGRRNFTGIILGIKKDLVQIEVEGRIWEFSLDNIKKANLQPEISFK